MSGTAKALLVLILILICHAVTVGFSVVDSGGTVHNFPFGDLDRSHASGIAMIEAYVALALSVVLGILLWRGHGRD